MKFRTSLAPIAAAAFLATCPFIATAQDVIIVEGERIETRDVRNTARDITVGSRATQEPLARFQRPICPGVWGLTEENGQAVVDRIYQNAEQAGIEIDRTARCGANVWVVVVNDVMGTFERLDDEDSFMTRHLTRYQKRKIRSQDGHALGWNIISDRNEQGERVLTGFEYTDALIGASAAGEPAPANPVRSMSRLETGIRSDIELSVVLIERSKLDGLDSGALADYATMRLLSYVEPPSDDESVDTILTLFEPGAEATAPQSLTRFDLAYLQSLYRSDEMRPGRMALGNISELMEKSDD